MKAKVLTCLFLAVGLIEGAAAAQAGRVISAVGDVVAERQGKSVTLAVGESVDSGDLLKVGKDSSLQVRFTDESVMALRANSQVRIDDYRFEKSADSDRSIFSLLKGGLRTITGLIGKANQKNYAVQTPTATIGIRGTHFVLVSCNADCFDAAGNRGPDGTFGGVTDGRIVVFNEAGEREFRQQEYFHVASRVVLPSQLLAPPALLNEGGLSRSRGAANARNLASAAGAASGSGMTTSGTPSTTNSPQLVTLTAPDTTLPAPVTTYTATQQPVLGGGGGSGIAFVQSNGYAYPSATITTNISADVLPASIISQYLGAAGITDAASLASAYRNAGFSVGYNAAADAYWVYEAPYTDDPAGHFGWHSAFGNAPVSIPTSGVAQYNFVGGTNPTDNFGRVGTFNPGNLSMDFNTQQIKNLSAMVMSFPTGAGQVATTYTIAANQTWSMSDGYNTAAVSCTGCMTGVGASVNGTFVGTNAQGYLGTVAVWANQLNGTYQSHAAGAVGVFAKQ